MPKLLTAILVSAALSTPGIALAETAQPQPAHPGKVPPMTAPAEKMPPAATTPRSGSNTAELQWRRPQPGEIRASKLIGTSVKNGAGKTIGDINEVVLGSDGKVAAVVVGVGGFLGLGEREVAVPFESLHLARNSGGTTTATLNATKESLKAAPEWKWTSENKK